MASVYRIRKEETAAGIRYLVDYRDRAGRRTKRRFKKARDAEAFKKHVEASTYPGLPLPRPVAITFAEWAETWFSQKTALSQAGKKPRPSTLQSWRSDVKSLLASFGDVKLHAITTETIVQYVQQLHITPIAAGLRGGGKMPREKSIRNKVGLLAQILRAAKARQIIPTNPAYDLDWDELLGVEIAYHRQHRMLPLTPAQLLQFLDAASATYTPKGHHEPTGPYYPFFEVAIWTGLRLGELLGLRWGDVELTSTPAVLTVRRSSYKGADVPTKSLAGMREVLLLRRVVHVLERYRRQCFGMTLPPGWQACPLFQTATGRKLDPNNTRQRHFLPILKRANLPHTRLHDLRECFATLLASEVHHRILHIVLGHEHLETTMHYYVKAERLRDLLQTTHPTVIAIRQELESLYRMTHRRYETGTGL